MIDGPALHISAIGLGYGRFKVKAYSFSCLNLWCYRESVRI